MTLLRCTLALVAFCSAAAQMVNGPPPPPSFGQMPIYPQTTKPFAPSVAYNQFPLNTATSKVGSCFNNCGLKSGSCWCDNQCKINGDCCADHTIACATAGLAPVPPAGKESCLNHCGLKIGTCWCDPLCLVNGDCCGDFKDICMKATMNVQGSIAGLAGASKSNSGPTCKDTCGFKAEGGDCWCDPLCEKNGDCCSDFGPMCTHFVDGGSVADNGMDPIPAYAQNAGDVAKPVNAPLPKVLPQFGFQSSSTQQNQQQQAYVPQQMQNQYAMYGYSTMQQANPAAAQAQYQQQYAAWLAQQQKQALYAAQYYAAGRR